MLITVRSQHSAPITGNTVQYGILKITTETNPNDGDMLYTLSQQKLRSFNFFSL